MSVTNESYIFGQTWEHERGRLGGLSAQFDPVTIRHLTAAGVAPGWRCLELGAGAGSVARWLADTVGADGRVVATDLDTRFLTGLPDPPVEVRRHDVAADPWEPASFDLIHARAVLEHVPDRVDVIARLVPALRPGGVLLVEDVVFGEQFNPVATSLVRPADFGPLYGRVLTAVARGLGAIGADARFGLDLLDALTAAGLAEVDVEFTARLIRGASPESAFYELSLRELAPRLTAAGLLAEQDATDMLAVATDPTARWLSLGLVSAWGRAR